MTLDRRLDAEQFVPSEAWIEAFRAQYSGALAELVSRYAARRVSGSRRGSTGDSYARELVVNALGDTLLGDVRWDPEARTLQDHLCDVIKRRTSADWDRAERLPHQSIDVVAQDGTSPLRDEVEHALRARLPDPLATEMAAGALAELVWRAASDVEVLALIDAKVREATSRAEVMRLTGFSPGQYRAARRRLNRIVSELPMQVRPRRKRTKDNDT